MNQPLSANTDSPSLEGQYTSMKRSLFYNFIKLVIFSFLVILMIEVVQLLWLRNFQGLIKAPLPIVLFIYTTKYAKNLNVKHDIVCLALYLLWNCLSLYNNFNHGTIIENFFATPIDSYYFSHATTLVGRIFAQKIPNLNHKIIFGILTTLARLAIVYPTKKAIYVREIIVLGLVLYIDMTQEKYEKDLFFQYSNYKNQLTKFRDLVVQDIPDGIAIVSMDLKRALFMNTSFQISKKEGKIGNIQDYLLEFIVQDTSQEGSTQTLRKSRILDAQSSTFYHYLQENFKSESALMNTRLTCNVIHSAKADCGEPNSLFEAKAFPIMWDEESAIAIVMHDITQQQTILGLQLADAHKDTVLATISHELRTPLNGILGMIQIMEKRVQDKDMLYYLSICKNSGSLLMGLVNSILDLNQIRSNKLQLNITRFSLNEFLKDMIQMFEFQCTKKKLKLDLKILSREALEFITTDKDRLSQIFINLLGNALKFTLKGGITISMDASSEPHYVQFDIEDTGIGIQDCEKDKLFKIFGRAEHHYQSINRHGVGLGLTISNNLVKILSESEKSQNIDLKSVYGEGTKFSFRIKTHLQIVQRPQISEATVMQDYQISEDLCEKIGKHRTFQVNNSKVFRTKLNIYENKNCTLTEVSLVRYLTQEVKPKILIVDDNPFNLVVAEQLVASHGYRVATVLSGQSAIEAVKEGTKNGDYVRLIFMDCQMPVMDGFEASRALKEMMLKKEIPDIPIVALTANSSDSDKKKSIRSGMCHHLMKPLKDSELRGVLNQFLPK